jgi:S-DNA-T family DNA segregation ATPase FtsK/SpoIIIE
MATKPRKASERPRAASAPKRVRTHHPVEEPAEVYVRPRRKSVLAQVVEGRGHEFGGVALLCLSVLLAMSVYFGIAGPLGRALEAALAALIGVGRFLMPVLVGAAGVAYIKRAEVQHRVRLTVGWSVVAVSALGLVHIVWGTGQTEFDVDALERAGGWFGWLVAQPLSELTTRLAAAVVLVAVMFCGVLVITASTPAELWRRGRAWVNGVSMPQRSSSVEPGDDDMVDDFGGEPQFYDIALDDVALNDIALNDTGRHDHVHDDPAPRKERKKRRAKPVVEDDAPVDEDEEVVAPAPRATKLLKGEPQQMPLGPGASPSAWSLPTLDMLTVTRHEKADTRATEAEGARLIEALREHGVDTELVGYTRGPTVTRYELSLGGGVKVAKVTSLSRDIAYTMAATDVRILAPIPGKSAIGIEVPNSHRELVSLGDLMSSQEARAAMHPLDVGVGKDIAGRSVFLNISTTPHMLIAGTTGAGKSSAINCIITSILMRSTPEQVRLILIDPKQVEMAQYARLPHLLTPPVTNPKKAANALGWAVKEMERRYDLLVEAGFRDIVGYNAAYDRGEFVDEQGGEAGGFERMPYILVVVDELNDLMMVAARDVEDCITRIAQKARAVGIHLIVATQRPSVNVITGVIKANIPARMAFAVSSLTDSRVILDQPGAEKLIGKGDMLLLPGNTSVAQRLQSAWVDEGEVRKVVGHWRRQAPEVVYVSGVDGEQAGEGGGGLFSTGDSEDDELLRQAMDLVVRTRQGSTSMLQRKLKVGFARAGRLMDLLESRGVVGPSEGSKPREVLMTVEELEELQRAG